MITTVDSETGAVYIRYSQEEVFYTDERPTDLPLTINVDYDVHDKIVGVKIIPQ